MPVARQKSVDRHHQWIANLSVGLLLIWAVVMFVNSKTNQSPPVAASPNPSPTIFHASSTMGGFTVEIPPGLTAEEKMGAVKFSNTEGVIHLDFVGTNYTNLEDHLSNPQNNILRKLKNQSKLTINDLETMSGFLGQEKNYFIYSKNTVYFINSSDSNLYNKLDQIAQSFRIPK